MKKKLSLLAYGLVLITIWSICFLGAGMADTYTAVMGLAFTFLSAYFLQREYDFDLSLSDKGLVMSMPTLFLCALYVTLYDYNYFRLRSFDFGSVYTVCFYRQITNPVVIAFIVLLLSLTKLRDLKNPRNVFIFASITIFYAYFFMFTWKSNWFAGKPLGFDTGMPLTMPPSKEASGVINYSINLSDYSFINANRDTVSLLDGSGKYILLETWAEGCPPCVRAMEEMPNFYQSIKDRMSVYYVYENRKASARRNFDKIFSFPVVKDKSMILVDIEQEFYHAANMQGYPYFLIFDPKGKLVQHIHGYSDREMMIDRISKIVGLN
jgi:thioredoxin-related protein